MSELRESLFAVVLDTTYIVAYDKMGESLRLAHPMFSCLYIATAGTNKANSERMSKTTRYLASADLTKTAFSLRFQQLQTELSDSLRGSGAPVEAILASQDRLILRMEGWVDSLADLHMTATTEIDLFRHTLATNRKVYRLKTLAIYNVTISEVEKDDLARALRQTIRKISTSRAGALEPLPLSGPH